ncbi:MAG: ABC transporter permease subunit [Phycisphaerales bacterium]|nr:MAG: ABC transporter permease subunit [Phycisphaerales bacterium]
MPTFLNWLLRLLPTNPICMRLVQGGSKRMRHLYIRSGYLAVMIVVLLFVLLGNVGGAPSMRDLASAGAQMFENVSYLQVGLICLLTPVFMAGAIAQEANPRTWDILLTTPLNNLQVVLGNIFGRLFFIIVLLFSSLPLFAVTQFFGGVPGGAIFDSYAIAAVSALLVAAIAVTLSVTRTAGRRAVLVFYVSVVMYLFVTYYFDIIFRQPIAPGARENHTTFMTPLNPFLALNVLLNSNQYVPRDPLELAGTMWITRLWLCRPIVAFCWLFALLSVVLILFSTLRLRIIGAKVGAVPWYRAIFGLGAKGAEERPARRVGHNPIAWRESVARGKTLGAILGRWGFVALGVAVAMVLVGLYHTQILNAANLRLAVASVVTGEIIIITLAALNMSATAVSREREDGTLDIILTTPIQPGPYIAGKLRGLIQFLLPMILVPVSTMAILALYSLGGGFGRTGGFLTSVMIAGRNTQIELPIVLPEGVIAMPLVLAPFIAFCVMVGLHWSIKSKGTIGSVVVAVGVVIAIVGVLSLCGLVAGREVSYPGAAFSTVSPVNLLLGLVMPEEMIPDALGTGSNTAAAAARVSLVVGAAITAAGYAVAVYLMHANIKRTFMMTVRRLAGTN